MIVQLNPQPVHSIRQFEHLAESIHPGQDFALSVKPNEDDGTVMQWLVGCTLPPPLRGKLS
ncbi:MAG: hypothetical protein ACRD1C_06915 [Terriglobales bacterium]